MKKILLILITCICLCGCNDNNQKLENDIIKFSELKIEDEHIVGQIKNTDDDKAYDVSIWFNLKSGSLEEEELCTERIKPGETKSLNCRIFNDEDSTYEIEISEVNLKEFDIPVLNEGKIDVDTLEYHFEDILNEHVIHVMNIVIGSEIEYPYISSVEYNDNIIKIWSYFEKDGNSIGIVENYDSDKQELILFQVFLPTGDENFIDRIATETAEMLYNDFYSINSIVNILLNEEDFEPGYCIKYRDWCISTTIGESTISFNFSKQ